MSHKVYRLCLLSVALIAIIGGIFYYLNYSDQNQIATEGTLVKNWEIMYERPNMNKEDKYFI